VDEENVTRERLELAEAISGLAIDEDKIIIVEAAMVDVYAA
jgi:hypothetical protein